MTSTKLVLAALAASLLAAAGTASADSKSWNALKGSIPADTTVVVGIDLKAVRGASSFPKLVTAVFAESGDIKTAVDLVKSMCSIDVINAATDVTLALATNAHNDQGVIAVGLDGVDEAKIVDCAGKIAKMQSAKAKITSKPGKITEYTFDDGTEKQTLYAMWPAKDVIVFSIKPELKSGLDAVVAGKPATATLGGFIGKATAVASSLVWVGAAIGKDGVKGGFGNLTLVKGTLAGSGKISADGADVATKMAADANKDLKDSIDRSKNVPTVQKMLKGIKIASAGSELSMDGSMAEADLATLIPSLDKLF